MVLAQSLESFSFWQELATSKCGLRLLRRQITFRSEIKSSLSQPAQKKTCLNLRQACGERPSCTQTQQPVKPSPQLQQRPRSLCTRNLLRSVTAAEQELLGDACCPLECPQSTRAAWKGHFPAARTRFRWERSRVIAACGMTWLRTN